ncbi:MAG: hypothetical protein ACI9JN_001261 [Bacteroidia bacterium]|jgi:hypothetical protein
MLEKQKEFRITSLSKSKDGQIAVKWQTPDGYANQSRKLPPHKDFQAAITKIEGYLAQYYNLNEDRVSMKSMNVVYYEDDKGESVSIHGIYTHPDSDQVTNIPTSKIPLHLAQYGWEQELKKTLKKVTVEAEKFIFENKSSQETMKLEVA